MESRDVVITEDDDESLTKFCSNTDWNSGPFSHEKIKNEEWSLLTPIEKLCKVDEVVDELDDLYE